MNQSITSINELYARQQQQHPEWVLEKISEKE